MTVEEIDAKIAEIRSEMGKYNFCTTLERLEIKQLMRMKEDLLKEKNPTEGPLQPQQPPQPLKDELPV